MKYNLLFLFCWGASSCSSQEYYIPNGYVNHSLCLNAHLGYSGYDFEYRSELSKILGELKPGMLRDYVFINSADLFSDTLSTINMDPRANRAYVMDNVLYQLHKNAPGVHMLGVLHDMKWELDKDVPFTQFYNLIKQAVKRYDGKSRFVPTDSQKEMSYEIKYWEICNEFDVHIYGHPPFDTAKKTFELLKNSYLSIKEANPNAMVVFPGIANTKCQFVKDMLEYKDDDGKRIWDYFDIFNFHVYPQTAEALPYYIGVIKKYQEKYAWNKPIWLTEIGWNELLNTDYEVAIQLPKMYLIALANGVEKIFQFQLRRFDYSLGESASYGLIKSSLDGTYVSLQSAHESLSLGTAYNHVLVRSPLYTLSPSSYRHKDLGNSMCQKLKHSGLSIHGNNYVIKKVSIIRDGKEFVVFNKETSGDVNIPASKFKDFDISDKVSITFKQYKNKVKWKRTDKTLSYYSVKQLINLLPNGATMPSLKVHDGVYEAIWYVGEKKITALWSEKRRAITFKGKGEYRVMNYMGKQVMVNPLEIELDRSILYLDGDVNYMIR